MSSGPPSAVAGGALTIGGLRFPVGLLPERAPGSSRRGDRATREPGRDASPGSPRAAARPGTVRTVLIHSGWEELDKPSGGFFKGGKREGARKLLGLRSTLPGFPGGGTRRLSRPGSGSLLGYPPAGVALRSPVLPSPQGRGKTSRDAGGAEPPAARCPRRGTVSGFHTYPTGGVRRPPPVP